MSVIKIERDEFAFLRADKGQYVRLIARRRFN
jgi:hypothetical protein